MPPKSRKSGPDLSALDMLRELGSALKLTAREPNINLYEPHDKQVKFHSSSAKVRLYIGGNRSGKTVGGTCEDIYYLRGNHPHRKVPEPPVRGRVVCVDFRQGIEQIIIPKFKQWLPPSLLINGSWEDSYNNEKKLLTLSNKSTLELMTYEQKLESFAGTSRHFIHFDEEPPQHIFNENMARLIDTDGDAWITMTPVEGMTWIYDAIYLPGINAEVEPEDGKPPGHAVIIVNTNENPHLNTEAINRVFGQLDDEERKAREEGQFVQLGGLVYKGFSRATHVIPALDPKTLHEWEWHRSMDHGFNNPTAWLWHAVSPDGGTVITFAEHYAREMIVEEHANVVHRMDKQFGKVPEFCIGDPATQQRNGVNGTSIAGTYAEYGIFIAPGNNDVLSGVERVSSYLKTNPNTRRPHWQITENCENLIRELERLRWKTYASKNAIFANNAHDQIHKKDDHAADAARYFFTMMPDLTPENKGEPPPVQGPVNNLRYDEMLIQQMTQGKTTTEWRKGVSPMEWD